MLLYSNIYKTSGYYDLYLKTILFWSVFYGLIILASALFAKKNVYTYIKENADDYIIIYLLSIAFCFFGLTIGLMTGLSESSVVESVITAIFSLFGGFASLAFFSKENNNKRLYVYNNKIISLFFITVSFCIMWGVDYGSIQRLDAQRKRQEVPPKVEQINPPLPNSNNIVPKESRPK